MLIWCLHSRRDAPGGRRRGEALLTTTITILLCTETLITTRDIWISQTYECGMFLGLIILTLHGVEDTIL